MAEQTASSSSKTRTRTARTFVPDSSDVDDDAIIPVLEKSARGRRLLAVSIPVMGTRTSSRGKSAAVKAQQTEENSSNGSLSLEASDYETPGTSMSTTPATSFGRSQASSSKRTRSRLIVADSDDEDPINIDEALAMQLQKDEDEAEYQNKRRKVTESDSDAHMETFMSPPLPTYKGKGKAKAVEPPPRQRTTRRSNIKKEALVDEEDLLEQLDDSEEDEFEPDEAESDDVSPPVSDSEADEPLMAVRARLQNIVDDEPSKRVRAKKRLTRAEKMEARRRTARFAHISDKWERKRAMNRERAEQQHPKLRTMWNDLQKIPVLDVERAEQPKPISRRLKPFQLEGLSWMIRQEKTQYRGGLLGDEMGMGKTIQAVSLIMSDYPAKEPTLVCVPPVALMQWSNDIRE